MDKEEILQFKKEVIILSDYPEVYEDDDMCVKLKLMRESLEREYDGLSEEDRIWVDRGFNKWLDFYLSNSCSGECSECECEDY
jgi:hypothetical protein